MAIVVQKYGGSSVSDVARIREVARRVARTRAEGKQVVVVVSAMGDTTDELLALARQVSESPSRRELDMLLTAGERISMALLSMALNALDVPAVSFTGSQSGIITNDSHSQARIVEVRPYRVQDELEKGKVVIVAGYQGVSYKKEVTTLGRGGSDTTAVALAAALGAEACEIYSDVDGVYTADPRVVPASRRIAEISYEEMQELSRAGAKVLNAQAVEFAKDKDIAIYARSTFGGNGQTVVERRLNGPRGRAVGIAVEKDLLLCTLDGASPSALAGLLGALEEKGAAPRDLLLEAGGGASFLLSTESLSAREAEDAAIAAGCAGALRQRGKLGMLSAVGHGLGDDSRRLQGALRLMAEIQAEVVRVFASGLRLSLLLPEEQVAEAARRLHGVWIEAEGGRASASTA